MFQTRRGIDGSYWLPRANPEAEAYLDSVYVRQPNQLKWFPKIDKSISAVYKNTHKGKIAYIVGKGPSLDLLQTKHIETDGPIIAINECIHVVERLFPNSVTYGTQLDNDLGEVCTPKYSKLFVGNRCANLYNKGVYKLIVDPMSFGLRDSCLSAEYAIMLARHMGCVAVEMYCFDGCVDHVFEYADCIGHDSSIGGPPERFASHKQIILDCARKYPLSWVIPTAFNKRVISQL